MRIQRRAFTLIELLVVIAIIAILAAILFPVFAQAKAAAKASADLSNVKQINLGMIQYTADTDDTYPRAWNNDVCRTYRVGLGSDRYHWQDSIYPYIKSDAIFKSPSANIPDKRDLYVPRERIPQDGFDGAPGNREWTDRFGSYAITAAYWGGGQGAANGGDDISCAQFGNDGGTPRSLTSIDDPAGTLFMSNGIGAFQISWPDVNSQPTKVVGTGNSQSLSWTDNHWDIRRPEGCEGAMAFPNNGRSNVTYPDGHAKSMAPGAALKKNTVANTPTFGALSIFTPDQD